MDYLLSTPRDEDGFDTERVKNAEVAIERMRQQADITGLAEAITRYNAEFHDFLATDDLHTAGKFMELGALATATIIDILSAQTDTNALIFDGYMSDTN